MKWAIIYDTGEVHTDEDGDIKESYGVICVVEEGVIMSHNDYYILTDDGWLPCKTEGLEDHVIHKLDIMRKVIAGRTVTRKRFNELLKIAKNLGL